LHNGFLAVVTTDTSGDPFWLADAKRTLAFVRGLTGEIEPRGADHPVLRWLPEGSVPREAAGWAVEQASDPVFLLGGPINKALKAGGWVASGLGKQAVRELLTGDCDQRDSN